MEWTPRPLNIYYSSVLCYYVSILPKEEEKQILRTPGIEKVLFPNAHLEIPPGSQATPSWALTEMDLIPSHEFFLIAVWPEGLLEAATS